MRDEFIDIAYSIFGQLSQCFIIKQAWKIEIGLKKKDL